MEHLAALIQAVASLAWVGFAFTALFTFKPEIMQALGRLRKAELFGQKIELNEELALLEKSAVAATKEAHDMLPLLENASRLDGYGSLGPAIDSILEKAADSPKLALIMLSAELERRALRGLATRGLLRGRPQVPVSLALDELRQYGIPPNLKGSLELFTNVRNRIIHGGAATDDDALSALDSGMTILRALDALPNETNVVYHPGVDIFSDADCKKPFSYGKGVILEVTSPGGVIKTKRIYPSTRTHFERGKQVAWEWNSGRTWPAVWYRDPDSTEIKYGWTASAEFIGRHLDEIGKP